MTDRKRTAEGQFVARPSRTPLGEPEVGDTPVEGMTAPGVTDPNAPVSRANRPHRVPVGQQDRLKFSQRPGYYRRVVNDDPNRPGNIQAHLDAGYEFVTGSETGGPQTASDPGKMSSRVAKHVGGGVVGYLMEQPMEYREEDLAARHQAINESEADMRRTMTGAVGRYGKVAINDKTEERQPI